MIHRRPAFAALALAVGCCISTLAAQTTPKITTPKEALGFNIGDDYQMANYTQLEIYWNKLAQESDRMKLVNIGPTAEGRKQYMAIITSPENIKKLDHYRQISEKLARAEGLTDDQAHALAREGKAVVWIDGGLHASETVGSQQLMETGLPAGQPQRRRDPALPARRHRPVRVGQSRRPGAEANWYMRRSEKPDAPLVPPDKRTFANTPRLYNKYIGHDDNRDFYMSNMPETTNMNRVMFASGIRRSCTTITRPVRPAR